MKEYGVVRHDSGFNWVKLYDTEEEADAAAREQAPRDPNHEGIVVRISVERTYRAEVTVVT